MIIAKKIKLKIITFRCDHFTLPVLRKKKTLIALDKLFQNSTTATARDFIFSIRIIFWCRKKLMNEWEFDVVDVIAQWLQVPCHCVMSMNNQIKLAGDFLLFIYHPTRVGDILRRKARHYWHAKNRLTMNPYKSLHIRLLYQHFKAIYLLKVILVFETTFFTSRFKKI